MIDHSIEPHMRQRGGAATSGFSVAKSYAPIRSGSTFRLRNHCRSSIGRRFAAAPPEQRVLGETSRWP